MAEKRLEDLGRTELLEFVARHDPEFAKKGPGKSDIVNRLRELGFTKA